MTEMNAAILDQLREQGTLEGTGRFTVDSEALKYRQYVGKRYEELMREATELQKERNLQEFLGENLLDFSLRNIALAGLLGIASGGSMIPLLGLGTGCCALASASWAAATGAYKGMKGKEKKFTEITEEITKLPTWANSVRNVLSADIHYDLLDLMPYSKALQTLQERHFGFFGKVAQHSNQPTMILDGRVIARPLTFKETIEARLHTYETVTDENRADLFRTSLDTCTTIVYDQDKINAKIIPAHEDLLRYALTGKKRETPFSQLPGIPIKVDVPDEKKWIAALEGDEQLYEEYKKVVECWSLDPQAMDFMRVGCPRWVRSYCNNGRALRIGSIYRNSEISEIDVNSYYDNPSFILERKFNMGVL